MKWEMMVLKKGKKSPCWGSSCVQVRRTTCLWGTEGYGSPHLTGLDSEDTHTHNRNTVKHLNFSCESDQTILWWWADEPSVLLTVWITWIITSERLVWVLRVVVIITVVVVAVAAKKFCNLRENLKKLYWRFLQSKIYKPLRHYKRLLNLSVDQMEIRYLFIRGRVDSVLVLWVIVVLQFLYERVCVDIIVVVIIVVICVWGIIIIILVFIILEEKTEQLLSSFIWRNINIICDIRPEFKREIQK